MRWLGLGLLLVACGCSQTFHVSGKDVPRMVERYRSEGRVVVRSDSDGREYELTRGRQTLLRVQSNTCVNDQCDIPAVPVEEIRTDAEHRLLTVPDHAPLRYDWIEGPDVVTTGFESPLPPLSERAPPPPKQGRPLRWLPGVQIGGSGYGQLVVRYAAFQYLQPELGAGMIVPGIAINASAGLVSEVRFKLGLAPYIGAAYGFGFAGGEADEAEGEAEAGEGSSVVTSFGSARVGLAWYFGGPGTIHRIGVDGGLWLGRIYDEDEGEKRSKGFIWPMAGLSWHAQL